MERYGGRGCAFVNAENRWQSSEVVLWDLKSLDSRAMSANREAQVLLLSEVCSFVDVVVGERALRFWVVSAIKAMLVKILCVSEIMVS